MQPQEIVLILINEANARVHERRDAARTALEERQRHRDPKSHNPSPAAARPNAAWGDPLPLPRCVEPPDDAELLEVVPAARGVAAALLGAVQCGLVENLVGDAWFLAVGVYGDPVDGEGLDGEVDELVEEVRAGIFDVDDALDDVHCPAARRNKSSVSADSNVNNRESAHLKLTTSHSSMCFVLKLTERSKRWRTLTPATTVLYKLSSILAEYPSCAMNSLRCTRSSAPAVDAVAVGKLKARVFEAFEKLRVVTPSARVDVVNLSPGISSNQSSSTSSTCCSESTWIWSPSSPSSRSKFREEWLRLSDRLPSLEEETRHADDVRLIFFLSFGGDGAGRVAGMIVAMDAAESWRFLVRYGGSSSSRSTSSKPSRGKSSESSSSSLIKGVAVVAVDWGMSVGWLSSSDFGA